MARLLILSCSQAKRADPEPLPAIERYDGPSFRVLRHYLQSPMANVPDTYIVSAEFGLVPAHRAIARYDRRMTPSRARELRSQVSTDLAAVAARRHYDETFFALGRDYRAALSDCLENVRDSRMIVATGGRGSQLTQLRTWLYHDTSSPSPPTLPSVTEPVRIRLRGVDRLLTADEVLDAARQAISQGLPPAARPHAWHVLVDGLPVSPKWLVSIAFGLSVDAFHSQDARRVLHQLGLETTLA